MKVKICGLTRPEDIKICENNKADLIGFINIKRSSRFVSLDKISELVTFLQDKKKAVLVIEPENLKDAEKTIKQSPIDRIQLHSLECGDVRKLKQNNSLKIIRAVGITETIDLQKKSEIENYARVCDSLLFDSQINGKSGGTGKQIPLEQAAEAAIIANGVNDKIKLFLAGGINLERIKREDNAIKKFFDYVDVNSGVEDRPGIKNSNKIKEFMKVIE